MNKEQNNIRDFIYLDLPKVSSIFSQITGGLVTGTEILTGNEKDQRNIRKYDLKIFTPEFGGTEKSSSQMVESRVMHHDLFNRVEKLLFENGFATDVNESFSSDDVESGVFYKKHSEIYYIRCTGWAIFEDYEKMKNIAQNHNKLMEFIKRSALSNIKDSQEYKDLVAQIEIAKKDANKEKDRNKKALLKSQISSLERKIKEQLESSLSGVDEWIIDGFSHWVDTFIQDAIYFHIYPFENYHQFHIKSALKRSGFVDGDVRFNDFAYTGRPNVKLSLFGLVTSVPPEGKHPFDPMKEFEGHKPKDDNDDPMGFESAFRGLFRGFDDLDNVNRH